MNIAEIRFNKVQIDAHLSQMKDFFQNTENDLDDRWEVFEYWSALSKDSHDGWHYSGFDDILCQDIFIYDGLVHCERYASINIIECLPDLLSNLYDADFFSKVTLAEFNEEHVEQVAEYLENLCKEQLMKDGIASFTYDW